MTITGSAIATAEVARVDASCSTFILVHSSLAMLTIGKYLELPLSYHTLGTVRYSPSCFFVVDVRCLKVFKISYNFY